MKKIIFTLLTLISITGYSQTCPTITNANTRMSVTCSLNVTGFGSGTAIITPTLSLGNNLSVAGTITNGIWNGSLITESYGGTGYNNFLNALVAKNVLFSQDTNYIHNSILTRVKYIDLHDSLNIIRDSIDTKLSIQAMEDSMTLMRSEMASALSTKLNSADTTGKWMYKGEAFTKAQSDSRYLQSFTEVDPTVPSYSKSLTAFSVIKSSTDPLYKSISYTPTSSEITTALGYTPYNSSNPAGYITSSNVYNAGYGISKIGVEPSASFKLDTTNVMTMYKADTAITSINGKINGKVPSLRTLSINGTSFDLSANRTWTGIGIELPSQTGQSGKFLQTNTGASSWQTVDKNTVGLSNVDNTSDANKPVSTATQTALNAKQGTITLTTTGSTGNATLVGNTLNIPNYTPSSPVGTNNATAYSAGTVYTLTTTSAKVTFGTTSPSITLPAAGTYIIFPSIKLQYAGLTTLVTQTCSFKVRRTNNTATDLPNATTSFNVPIVTLLTQTAGDCDIAPIIYTTSNNNDVIEIWGNSGASVSVGSLQVGEASIVSYRIY